MKYKLTKLEYELIKTYIENGYHYMCKLNNNIVFSVFPLHEEVVDQLNSKLSKSMFSDIEPCIDYSLEEIMENIFIIKN